jgi:hypothetical protein
MTPAQLWRQWRDVDTGAERLVLRTGVLVRLSALGIVALALPLVIARFPQPAVALLLYLAMVLETAVVLVAWTRYGGMRGWVVLLELLVNSALLFVNGWFLSGHDASTWAFFCYPYTVLVGLGVGLACRRLLVASAVGLCWAAVAVTMWAVVHGVSPAAALAGIPTYLVDPLAGWLSARLLRRNTRELDEAGEIAVVRASELAAQRVRAKSSRALHDRVLQTLEALSRGSDITDQGLRDRVVRDTAWLRAFVETGSVEADRDLTVGLETVARLAGTAGLHVEVNQAVLRMTDGAAHLADQQRVALVEATHDVLDALSDQVSEVIVRASPEDGGVLVTVLATSAQAPTRPLDLAFATDRLTRAGGRLVAEPVPYFELWVPVS